MMYSSISSTLLIAASEVLHYGHFLSVALVALVFTRNCLKCLLRVEPKLVHVRMINRSSLFEGLLGIYDWFVMCGDKILCLLAVNWDIPFMWCILRFLRRFLLETMKGFFDIAGIEISTYLAS